MTIADTILNEYSAILTAVLVVIATIQWYLGPEADYVERWRGSIFRKLNPIAKQLGRPLVHVASEQEYICSVDVSVDELERAIHPTYRRNLTATKKAVRDSTGGLLWTEGSWSHKDSPTAEKQHHVFPVARENRVDVYGHFEDNVTDPKEHLDASNQVPGDPNNTLRKALDSADIDYYSKS